MGHTRLRYLPKTHRWNAVVGLLDASPGDTAAIATATTRAAERRLRELRDDPSIGYCFWILTRISAASREPEFKASLAELGLAVRSDDTALSFVTRLTRHVQERLADFPESGPFGDLASLALRGALSDTVGQSGRSLFGSSLEDVQDAFRGHSTPVRFGILAKCYFGDFLARTLRYYVEREVANTTGGGHALASDEDGRAFTEALDRYTRQTARIMETFAADWYSKRNWQSEGRISREEAQGFVAVALKKLRADLSYARPW